MNFDQIGVSILYKYMLDHFSVEGHEILYKHVTNTQLLDTVHSIGLYDTVQEIQVIQDESRSGNLL